MVAAFIWAEPPVEPGPPHFASLRKDRLQVSQRELADAIGVSQATVSRWESGELDPSRADLAGILKFARQKGIDLPAEDLIAAGPKAA